MSELKAQHIVYATIEYDDGTRDGGNDFDVYDKSEADTVIAHQKYKRCLAMAKWCDEVMMSCELRGYTVHRIWYNRHQWAMRWKYKWLELAEKFKEAK